MKVEVVTNEKDTLEFFIEGERHTLPNLLKEKLGCDANVEFCAYRLDHPLDQKARFIVKGKNPKKAVEDAVKQIKSDIGEFGKAFEKVK
jgi:DNA-directed RNA polymerase subunit L